ncbi:uncharacterized protein [Clytia hemisphaerica]|uniref:uncharacterized protein n=1 Tax=Clytia hemisphaerica TaxID=252671 RepID=UPI0034D63345
MDVRDDCDGIAGSLRPLRWYIIGSLGLALVLILAELHSRASIERFMVYKMRVRNITETFNKKISGIKESKKKSKFAGILKNSVKFSRHLVAADDKKVDVCEKGSLTDTSDVPSFPAKDSVQCLMEKRMKRDRYSNDALSRLLESLRKKIKKRQKTSSPLRYDPVPSKVAKEDVCTSKENNSTSTEKGPISVGAANIPQSPGSSSGDETCSEKPNTAFDKNKLSFPIAKESSCVTPTVSCSQKQDSGSCYKAKNEILARKGFPEYKPGQIPKLVEEHRKKKALLNEESVVIHHVRDDNPALEPTPMEPFVPRPPISSTIQCSSSSSDTSYRMEVTYCPPSVDSFESNDAPRRPQKGGKFKRFRRRLRNLFSCRSGSQTYD